MSTSLPTIGNYGTYNSGNYDAHSLVVSIGPLDIWYSYRTPVAFHIAGHYRVVRDNEWGPTAGKHLNWIDGGNKAARVSGEEFEKLWEAQVLPLFADPIID